MRRHTKEKIGEEMRIAKERAHSARRALRAWRRDGGVKRMKAALLSVALVLSQLLGALAPTVALAAESSSWFDNPNGTRYISDVVGVTREQVVGELESHQGDSFYLGTPYLGLGDTGDMPRPNGDHGSYRAGMQCTGFVCYVMAAAGGNPYSALSTNGANWWNTNVWERICKAQDVVSYRFDTKEELLASGLAQRGDIIVATPDSSVPVSGTDRYGNTWDGHAGFFWGSSPSEDLMWHSVHSSNGFGTIESGNQTSAIQGKVWPSHYILIPLGQSRGRVTVTKASSDPAVTDGNTLYSVGGAVYGLFSDEGCTKDTGVRLTTREDGTSEAVEVSPGTYWARELSAPRGYALSNATTRVEVPAGGEADASASDVPKTNPLGLVLAKADAETGEASPLGAASLAGAEFEVRYYAGQYDEGSLPAKATRTWTVSTGEDGTADLSSATGDDLYRDAVGNAVVPLGTVAIRETRAPEGYVASDKTFVTRVTAEGTAEHVSTYAAPTVAEQVRRGDLELVKAESGSMRRLAGVPFRITSATTGESHVIVTDENGQASTASSWASHATRTNANDTAGEGSWDAAAGVWFSGTTGKATAPDDSKGALPYDTYAVEELRCAANEGLRLVSMTVTVSRDARTVELGTVDDDQGPRIATTLTGKGGERLAEAAGSVTLTDEVEYENLEPGKEYELTGTLMDRETGKAVTGADGKAVTATAKLTPKLSTGKAKVTFEFDATGLAGHSVVAFEELSQGGKTVATHADIDDEGQTVLLPKIGTTATDAEDGSHDAAADDDVTITDTVEYQNLVPGKEYELTGTLMDRETGEPVRDAKGEKVTATTRLTPEEASGTATVTFRFDGSDLAGRTVVAFEELSREGHVYATHSDLSDEGQSVAFPQVRTTASDAADGDKVIDAAPGQRVADTVSYSNVTPGTEYRVRGHLLDAETSEELATAETTVTPESSEGTVEVAFDVDGTGHEGRKLVCTEELSRADKVVATHADLKDEGQTVSLPGIHTTATDAADGDHEATAADKVTITDRVEWSGLVKGREYTVTGTLMDKSTGEGVKGSDGSPVTASATFTADDESGSTDVTFEFDGSALAGHDVVAFETIAHDGRTVATHADLEDRGQTVSITEAPPESPKGEKATKGGGQLPKTGDAGIPVAPIAGLCAAAGLSLAGARALRRRGKRGEPDGRIERGPEGGTGPLGGGGTDD
jgi:LPXTG-motif cell wall-anchored protein